MEWLRRYLEEMEPTLKNFAEIKGEFGVAVAGARRGSILVTLGSHP